MFSNPIVLAIITSLMLGAAMVPWNHALKHMTSSQFMLMLGGAFIAASEVVRRLQGQPFTFSLNYTALGLAIVTIVLYVPAICISGPMYKMTTPQLFPVVAAILAAFAIPAMMINAAISRTLPSLIEVLFIALTIIGVVGLNLVSKPLN